MVSSERKGGREEREEEKKGGEGKNEKDRESEERDNNETAFLWKMKTLSVTKNHKTSFYFHTTIKIYHLSNMY